MEREELIDELTLALIHLTSWEEKDGLGSTVRRAWKSYDWNALDRLGEQELISTTHRSKSVYLTEQGKNVAKATAEAYEASIDAFYEYVGEIVRSTRPIANEPAFEFRITLDLGGSLTCWHALPTDDAGGRKRPGGNRASVVGNTWANRRDRTDVASSSSQYSHRK